MFEQIASDWNRQEERRSRRRVHLSWLGTGLIFLVILIRYLER